MRHLGLCLACLSILAPAAARLDAGPAAVRRVTHQAYWEAMANGSSRPASLKAIGQVAKADGLSVTQNWRWLDHVPPGSTDEGQVLAAMLDRVQVALRPRPAAFAPAEVRRRLQELLDRLEPARVRARAMPADEPVRARVVWTSGSGCSGRGGGSTVSRGGSSSTSGGRGSGRGSPGAAIGSGGPGSALSRIPAGRVPARAQAAPSGAGAPGAAARLDESPASDSRSGTTAPTTSKPDQPPRAPSPPPQAPPPPPPPKPIVEPRKAERSSWACVYVAGLLVALLGIAQLIRRARRDDTPSPVPRPRSVAELLDPCDRDLDTVGIVRTGQQAATGQDWMKAMRYLFAGLLSHLVEHRRIPVADWHTNFEIAGLIAQPRLAESFWSAATIFELFWFGEKVPLENDFRLLETLVGDCTRFSQEARS